MISLLFCSYRLPITFVSLDNISIIRIYFLDIDIRILFILCFNSVFYICLIKWVICFVVHVVFCAFYICILFMMLGWNFLFIFIFVCFLFCCIGSCIVCWFTISKYNQRK